MGVSLFGRFIRFLGIVAIGMIPLVAGYMECTFAEEKYADVSIEAENWRMREMQTFSGTVPSRAWVFGRILDENGRFKNVPESERERRDTEAEVVAAVLVTEGITGGLKPQKQTKILKLYVESLIQAWGGKTPEKGGDEIEAPNGFCGNAAGYRVESQFGEIRYTYYGCALYREDAFRIVMLTTWMREADDQLAAERFRPFLHGLRF